MTKKALRKTFAFGHLFPIRQVFSIQKRPTSSRSAMLTAYNLRRCGGGVVPGDANREQASQSCLRPSMKLSCSAMSWRLCATACDWRLTSICPRSNGEPLPGKHPALLHRTQYDKTAVERGIGWCRWFAERGYVAILQDSRGTFESEGVTNFFIPEAEDGFDTLEWIGRQTWSNGQVGNWGISWAGWTQTAMAALGPPNQGTLVPTFSGSNAYTSTIRQGGAFELRLMGAAFWVSAFNRKSRSQAGAVRRPCLESIACPDQ